MLGVDFDNTLARYDDLLLRLAREQGWLESEEAPRSKREIRDRVRALPDGEQRWQLLQAHAYGSRLHEAPPFPGARDVLAHMRALGAEVHIVSHKSVYAAADRDGVDLRDAARSWLAANGFLHPPVSIAAGDVHFEPDRRSKLRRISELRCTHFVDDLEETYLEPDFPDGVERILLLPGGGEARAPRVSVCRTWDEVGERVLGS